MARNVPRGDRTSRSQLALDLPHEPRLGPDDFLVARWNEDAHRTVTAWPAWHDRTLLLTGPEGSGKTHLLSIWATQSGAELLSGPMLSMEAVERLRPGATVAVDDVDDPATEEPVLFHLVNHARERDASLLLAARSGPTLLWPRIADLSSRLRAMPRAVLESPDEAAVRAVLVKLLHDRQLVVEASVVDYLARRLDRSIGVARSIVADLDRAALEQNRRVTRALAASILERHGNDEP
jgi:chromosomal replication initiation ATPase DnaA